MGWIVAWLKDAGVGRNWGQIPNFFTIFQDVTFACAEGLLVGRLSSWPAVVCLEANWEWAD